MTFTIQGVQLRMGETATHRHMGYKMAVTPVLLAAPLKRHPVGTEIGRVQRKEYSGKWKHAESATFTSGCAVLGHDYDWLVREFKENQGGERQARLERIQPGRLYLVMRLFGYPSHDRCIYEKGTTIEIKAVNATTITTRIRWTEDQPSEVSWKRDGFEALVTAFAIRESEWNC